MIEIKDLSLTFKNADEDHEALKAVTLDIPEGCIYGSVTQEIDIYFTHIGIVK